MNRRRFIAVVGFGAAVTVAGCTGDNGDGVELSYSVSDPKSHEDIPSEVVEHPNPDGFQWIVVTVSIEAGSIDATDILGLTQIDTGSSSEPARAVTVSPSDDVLTESSEEHTMDEGVTGDVYYRVSDDVDSGEWVTEQLENQYGDIDIQAR